MPVVNIEGYNFVYFGNSADDAKVRRQLRADTKTAKASPKRGVKSRASKIANWLTSNTSTP